MKFLSSFDFTPNCARISRYLPDLFESNAFIQIINYIRLHTRIFDLAQTTLQLPHYIHTRSSNYAYYIILPKPSHPKFPKTFDFKSPCINPFAHSPPSRPIHHENTCPNGRFRHCLENAALFSVFVMSLLPSRILSHQVMPDKECLQLPLRLLQEILELFSRRSLAKTQ